MNTSFSKYVKQCKWGLSLDTAGSDYSAHQLARLLTTILGRLPGPSAQRWEESPFPAQQSPSLGLQHLYGGDWRASAGGWGAGGWGAGGWEGPLTLYFPPGEAVPGAGRSWAEAGAGIRSISTWDTRESDSHPGRGRTRTRDKQRQGLESFDLLGNQTQRSRGLG